MIMKTKYRLTSAFVLSVFFTFTCVFAGTNNNIKNENFQDQKLEIYKKKENGLDVYTFTPKNQIDKELMEAIENRLKVITEQAVLSFSADDKNLVTLKIAPDSITEDGLNLVLAIVVKIHEYYSSDYIIIEL